MRTMMQSFRRHKDTSGSVPTYWMPPGQTDVESTEEEDSDSDSVRGGERTDCCDASDLKDEPFRGVANTTNNPCGQLPGNEEDV